MANLVCGIGINDADYVTQKYMAAGCANSKHKKLVWICPYYRAWKSMIARCYNGKLQIKRPTYAGCYVAKEWLVFSNFKKWMTAQDWEGKQLDKDILFPGNKSYSPETCAFVSSQVNAFVTDRCAARGEWPVGVCWSKYANRFQAKCCNPFTNKQKHLGYFDNEQDAHQAWLKYKFFAAHQLAAIQVNPKIAIALMERYSCERTAQPYRRRP